MTESIVRHSMGGSTVQKSKIIVGDCLDKMREMETNSVDSIVTDPPYGLSFMGKDWDHGVPGVAFWREALRVLKPGGHMLAFGGTRTFHRLVCAIEDAGFEIRDQIMWLYGSGFPKGCDFTTQFDEALLGIDKEEDPKDWEMSRSHYSAHWEGFNVAIKPAHEPICVARKPMEGTVAANVLKWGTGAINIDKCRVHSSTSQRPEDDDTWEGDQRLCVSCADHAAQSAKHGTPETRAFTATKLAKRISSEREETSLPGIVKTDTGCSGGMKAESFAINSSIAECGKKQTVPSLVDMKFTTSTKIAATTGSKTCASCGKPITSSTTSGNTPAGGKNSLQEQSSNANAEHVGAQGRWPSNLIHDGSPEVLAGFPEAPGQQGNLIGHSKDRKSPNGCFGKMGPARNHTARVESNKSAARFFKQCEMGDEDWHHQQKLDHLARNAASRSEQCETHIAAEAAEIKTSGSKSEASQAIPGSTGNCESCTQIRSHAQSAAVMENTDTTQITASLSKSSGFAHHVTGENTNLESKGKVAAGNGPEVATRFVYCPKASKKDRDGSTHPTMKPTDLMRYLCRLVTPPGGLVLDPFCGSGSTGKAAVLEGFRFIGIELSEEYAVIGEARIADASNVMKITAKEEKQLSFL